jgi:hypothetical protein
MTKVMSLAPVLFWAILSGCSSLDSRHSVFISVADQKMMVADAGVPIASYPISTSKFGLGAQPGSLATPLVQHRVAKKIGSGLPLGAVLKSRKFTGEILPPNSSGRDSIVTRILWLGGMEPSNKSSRPRHIYIHGTAEEQKIGLPASYGCIRMRSSDIAELFDLVGVGAKVEIIRDSLSSLQSREPS